MGYINQDMELDAILTKRGRELLTNDPSKFKITKFSLADDELDYRLWNTSHSLGTDYYGELIESTPIIEPLPNGEQQGKFNLITLPKETTIMPTLSLGITEIELKAGQEYYINPFTSPNIYNLIKGYTLTIWDYDFGLGAIPNDNIPGDDTEYYTSNMSLTGLGNTSNENAMSILSVKGLTFVLKAGSFEDSLDHKYRITVKGNETGDRVSIPVTVKGKYSAQIRA